MLTRAAGFSLVELLVAMVAGLLVLAGALSLFTTVLAAGSTNLVLSRLNLEVQAVVDVISRDLQKAGYTPHAVTELALNHSATPNAKDYIFSATEDLYTDPSGNGLHCIRLKYWDTAAVSGEEPSVRIYSYHSGRQTLELYTGNNTDAGTALSTLCGSGSKLISDKEISIEQLEFTPMTHANAASIKMTITAGHAQLPHLTTTLTRYVYLRNGGR